MNEEAPNAILVEDEILQLMFWMQGEGLGREVPLTQLSRFLVFPAEEIRRAAETLIGKGQLEALSHQPELLVRLSAAGYSEGARRFQDEFDPYLGHDSHLVCDDPNCDCHTPDWDGACSHLGRLQ